MKTSFATAVLSLGLVSSFDSAAHKPQADEAAPVTTAGACDPQGRDHSTMSAAEHGKWMADCARAKASPRKACDMGGMDMSTMPAAEHQKMMADCAAAPALVATPKGGA